MCSVFFIFHFIWSFDFNFYAYGFFPCTSNFHLNNAKVFLWDLVVARYFIWFLCTFPVDVLWLLYPLILQAMLCTGYFYPSESTQSLLCRYAYPQSLWKLVQCYFTLKRSLPFYISFLHFHFICVFVIW